MVSDDIRRDLPSSLTFLAEHRALWELGGFGLTLPLLLRLPRGDGHRVVVLPPHGRDDWVTAPLRWLLERLGYRVTGWGIGANVGGWDRLASTVVGAFDQVVEAERGSTVSLVGWSLGGVYARNLARHAPQAVRAVVTLASPYRPMERDRGVSPPPVPRTSVFSRLDAVVRPDACHEPEGDAAESIRVFGSHFGLAHNPLTVAIVADRLAQPPGSWRPFRARDLL